VWFAPNATELITAVFFPPRRRSRSSFFVFGGCFFLLFFLWLIAAACALFVAAFLTCVIAVWGAQLLVLVGWGVYTASWYGIDGIRRLAS
jgi:hypothetical protein